MNLRKLLNIFLIFAVFVSWGRIFFAISGKVFGSAGLSSLKYFTILSNLLEAFASLIWLIKRNEELKYIAAVSVTLTMITVLVFLGPIFGYFAMFAGANLWLHLLVPLMALLEVLFLNKTRFDRKANFHAALPMVIYGIFYLGNILLNGVGEWPRSNDWYGFCRWGIPVGIGIYFFIAFATYMIGFCTRKLGELIIKKK